jgi:hypothetical protein
MKKFHIKRSEIKYQLIWIPIVVYFIGIIFFNVNINSKTIDIVLNKEANVSIGEITKDTVIEQSFVSPSDNVDSIDVQFATYGRKNDSTLYVKLYDVANDLLLFTWHFSASDIEDNSYLYLKIPNGILITKNGEYRLTFDSDDAVVGNSVTIWASNSDRYKLGKLTINGSNFLGDLVITFHILKRQSKMLIILYSLFSFSVVLFFAKFTVYYMSKRVNIESHKDEVNNDGIQ